MSTAIQWPTFDGPAHIPYDQVTHRLWGDSVSGEVADWIYVSSSKIHQVVFGLPPGGGFRHSERCRTIFAADEVFCVLSGVLVLSNPETGEVHRLETGDAAFFRRDTWHHGFSYGSEPLRVLEFFAPPPSQGTSQAYARTKPYLESSRYVRDEWIGHWPECRDEARRQCTMRVLRTEDILWRLEGHENQVLTGILASTDQLTAGRIDLMAGQKSDVQVHGGDEGLYLVEGTLNVHLPETEGRNWFELKPGDGFYVPEGTPHQYFNMTGRPASFYFGAAPLYLAA